MKKIILFSLIFGLASSNLFSQSKYDKSVFIDGTYLFSFFKTSEARITPLNMKIHLKNDVNLRFGFNLDNSSAQNKGFEGDLMVGVEKIKNYSPKWSLIYGLAVNTGYISYNDRPNTTMIYSCIPFFGFEVNFTEEFSLVYEPKFFFNYYDYSDPDSFSLEDNDELESKLSGLSQFYIKFNF